MARAEVVGHCRDEVSGAQRLGCFGFEKMYIGDGGLVRVPRRRLGRISWSNVSNYC
jgi:hypothetical protein